MPYRIAALESAEKFVESLDDEMKRRMWDEIGEMELEEEGVKPVVVARKINVLAALAYANIDGELSERLMPLIKNEAWSVREASCLALARLGEKAALSRKLVDALSTAYLHIIQDRKFAKCRTAGYRIIRGLLLRAERGGEAKELVIVYKEQWESKVKRGLGDNDVGVTGLASECLVKLNQIG